MLRIAFLSLMLVTASLPSAAQQRTISVSGGQAFLTSGDHTANAIGAAYSQELTSWLAVEGEGTLARSEEQRDEFLLFPFAWRDRTQLTLGANAFVHFRAPLVGGSYQELGPVFGPTLRYRRDNMSVESVSIYNPDQAEEDAEADRVEQEMRTAYPEDEVHRFTVQDFHQGELVPSTGVARTQKEKAVELGIIGGLRYQIGYDRFVVGVQPVARSFLFGSGGDFAGSTLEVNLRLGYRF